MKTLHNLAVVCVLACLLAGCASTSQYTASMGAPETFAAPDLAPPAGMARIIVMRVYAFTGSGVGIRISDGGRPVGRLGAKGVIQWDRVPGTIVVGASASNETSITISANEGEIFFFEARTNWGAGFNSAACELRMLSRNDGLIMLRGLRK
jgi:hypothetical protein